MSDDLVKRLRDTAHGVRLSREAADRIEELEAKLAKAMEEGTTYSNDPHLVKWARRALAELKGKADE